MRSWLKLETPANGSYSEGLVLAIFLSNSLCYLIPRDISQSVRCSGYSELTKELMYWFRYILCFNIQTDVSL